MANIKVLILPIFKKYWKLLISIIIVSALGCSIMTGLSSGFISLKDTLNSYVTNYNYPDIQVSTNILLDEKIESLKSINGIEELNYRLNANTIMISPSNKYLSIRAFSYDEKDFEKFYYWSKSNSNLDNGIMLEYNFATENNINVNDRVKVKIGEEYRSYLVTAIISNPNTFSMSLYDKGESANFDFGYIYFSNKLLKQETEKETKNNINKQELEHNKEEILNNISEFETYKDELQNAIKDLSSGKDTLISKRKELLQTKKVFSTSSIDDALSEIDNKLETIDKQILEFEDYIVKVDDNVHKLKNSITLIDAKLYGYEHLFNQILIKVKNDSNINNVLEQIKNELIKQNAEIINSFTFENSGVKGRIDANLIPLNTMSIFTPMIFFAIILIVVFLFMSLIIKQSRREIGILRALGYTKNQVKLLFCIINIISSCIAIILGFIIGLSIATYIGNYYTEFFPIPFYNFIINYKMFIISSILTIIIGQVATIISTTSIASIAPNEAMSREVIQDKPISNFMTNVTNKLKPFTKFNIITLFRNKIRFIFAVLCISATIAMIFSSFTFINSKNDMLCDLFDRRINYDVQVFFKNELDENEIIKLKSLNFVNDLQIANYYSCKISANGKSENINLYAIPTNTNLINIYDINGQKTRASDTGIIIDKYLAERLNVQIGSNVTINNKELLVTDISNQNYDQTQYISIEQGNALGLPDISTLLLNIQNGSDQALLNNLINYDDYLYTSFTKLQHEQYIKQFETFDLMAWILIGFAILIGFVIVVNTNLTNLLEQKKKLCILRTLGFTHTEISLSWFKQILVQFSVACIIGFPIGIQIAKITLEKLSTNHRHFIFINDIKQYLFTFIIVLLYVIISHFISMKALKHWNITETIKERE